MSVFFIQIPCCLALAALSYWIEKTTGSKLVTTFLENNGLLLICALFAINSTCALQTAARLHELEKEHNKPYALDGTKKALIAGIYEQLIVLGIYYFLMAATPASYWTIGVTHDFISFATLPNITARACLFMSMYATHDYARSSIRCYLNPESL